MNRTPEHTASPTFRTLTQELFGPVHAAPASSSRRLLLGRSVLAVVGPEQRGAAVAVVRGAGRGQQLGLGTDGWVDIATDHWCGSRRRSTTGAGPTARRWRLELASLRASLGSFAHQ